MSETPSESRTNPPHMAEQRGPVVWVLASGPVALPESAIHGLGRPDVVIAADGGSSLAARLGLVPNLIVGDLDSSDVSIVADFEAQGVEVQRYDHHTKQETDTELAVFAALDLEPCEVVLLGALGGRLDHALANILLLTNPRLAGTRVRIVHAGEQFFVAHPGTWTEVYGEPGDTVSLLPVGGSAAGVRLVGFVYPLNSEPLPQGYARGVSNRLVGPLGLVWIEAGMLLVVQSRGQRQVGEPC